MFSIEAIVEDSVTTVFTSLQAEAAVVVVGQVPLAIQKENARTIIARGLAQHARNEPDYVSRCVRTFEQLIRSEESPLDMAFPSWMEVLVARCRADAVEVCAAGSARAHLSCNDRVDSTREHALLFDGPPLGWPEHFSAVVDRSVHEPFEGEARVVMIDQTSPFVARGYVV
jgi:hypothetical protein